MKAEDDGSCLYKFCLMSSITVQTKVAPSLFLPLSSYLLPQERGHSRAIRTADHSDVIVLISLLA